MSGDTGKRLGVSAVDEVQIRMAQTTGLGVDQDLVRHRIGDFDIADDEAVAGLFKDGCFCQILSPPFPNLARCAHVARTEARHIVRRIAAAAA